MGGVLRHHAGRPEAEQRHLGPQVIGHPGPRHHGALRRAGGTGGEEDAGQLLAARRLRRRVVLRRRRRGESGEAGRLGFVAVERRIPAQNLRRRRQSSGQGERARHQPALGGEEAEAAVAQHRGKTHVGVGRFERHPRRRGFEDAGDCRQHADPALAEDAHPHLAAGPPPAQPARHPRRPRTEVRVAHALLAAHRRHRLGMGRHPPGEDRREAARGDLRGRRGRGAIEVHQQARALGRGQDLEVADGRFGSGRDALQQALEAGRQPLDRAPVEGGAEIGELDLYRRTLQHVEGEVVVGPLDRRLVAAELQVPRREGARYRLVVEDEKAVEKLAGRRDGAARLDVGERQMAVLAEIAVVPHEGPDQG